MTQSEAGLSAERFIREYLAGSASHDEKISVCLSAGVRMEGCGDFESAVTCYALALTLPPQLNAAWYYLHNNLGYSLSQLGRHEEAELFCRQAIAIDATKHNAFKNLGVALEGLGSYEEAAQRYAQATELNLRDTRAFGLLEGLIAAHPELPEHVEGLRARLLDLYLDFGFTCVTAAEAKVTAAVYAQLDGVLEHVRSHGRLPQAFDSTNAPDILQAVLERRGIEIDLTVDEQLVLDAISTDGYAMGGVARLSDPAIRSWQFFDRV